MPFCAPFWMGFGADVCTPAGGGIGAAGPGIRVGLFAKIGAVGVAFDPGGAMGLGVAANPENGIPGGENSARAAS